MRKSNGRRWQRPAPPKALPLFDPSEPPRASPMPTSSPGATPSPAAPHVLNYLQSMRDYGATVQEICRGTSLPPRAIASVCTRLLEAGLIRKRVRPRRNRSRRWATVWLATENASGLQR